MEFKFHAFADSPFSGHIGTQDYGGTVSDILLGTYGAGQTGATNPYDWRSTYFSGFSNENDLTWAFYYFQGNDLGWTDAYNLPCNTGDIVA